MNFDVFIQAIKKFIDIILHIDSYLGGLILEYDVLVYGILFLIIFCETGLVFVPFLPGDSLLFAAGSFASLGTLNLFTLIFSLWFAAVLGDTLNYSIGYLVGEKISRNNRFISKRHLEKTQIFFAKHGGKTIVLARFAPILRTFAPFIAGIGRMKIRRFLVYNIVGGLSWVVMFTVGGFYMANIPLIKENFSLILVLIIVISLIPFIAEFINYLWGKKIER
jgi:membrane-associated protein